MLCVLYFLLWTLLLYWIHRIGHKISWINKYHSHHHALINNNLKKNIVTKWHWNNLFLVNDDWISTVDLWITEVIPTILFCLITNQVYIFVFYYIWTALIQENLEHNPAIDYPLLTTGRYHLIHHRQVNKNFCLFFPVWDILFKTYDYKK
jgi:sterol desaturase/sphingolipid hydroxylase (fatty acid hydroxylase superfamily)